jgi:hypothetical protein
MIGNFQKSKPLNIREREYRCLCSYYVINTYAILMYELKTKLESYLRVNLLGPGPSSYKKVIYRAAVSRRLGNPDLRHPEDGEHLPKHVGVNLEHINKIHWLLDAFCWSFATI